MATRTTIAVVVGVLAVGAAGLGVAAAVDDPDRDVEPVTAGGFNTPTTSPSAASPTTISVAATSPAVQTVEGLEQLSGALVAGEDPDDWSVAGVDVDFGPEGWLASGELEDFDDDGAVEIVGEELGGLSGVEVTLGVRYEVDDDGDRDDADVFTINARTYRDPDGVAPWQAGAEQSAADRATIEVAAVDAVGANARVEEIERENDDGWDGWDVEVRDAGGRRYHVLVDQAGNVVDVRPDND